MRAPPPADVLLVPTRHDIPRPAGNPERPTLPPVLIHYRRPPVAHRDESYENLAIARALAARVPNPVRIIDAPALTPVAGHPGDPIADLDGAPLPALLLARNGSKTTWTDFSAYRALESAGIRVLNQPDAIMKCIDKFWTAQLLEEQDLPTPATVLVSTVEVAAQAAERVGFPAIVKANVRDGSHGDGIFFVRDLDELRAVLQMKAALDPDRPVLLQECCQTGLDLRVLVVGKRCVAAMKRSAPGRLIANCSQGGSAEPIEITREMRRLALAAAKALGLEIAGVDLLLGHDERLKICEVNSAPGFKALQRTHPDLDIAGAIAAHAATRLRRAA